MLGFLKNSLRRVVAGRQHATALSSAADAHQLLQGNAIHMVDVGASGGVLPRWHPYRSDIAFVGLEPDSRSSAALLASPEAAEFREYRIIPHGAWNRPGRIGISFTRKPMCSSHFQPNIEFLSRFPEAERFDVVGAGEVECRTIDELLGPIPGASVDFIKLDLEGGELAVLQGATNTLESCLGLHIEVCFQRLRKEQPLFGDVTEFLSQRGIEFIDFVSIIRWERTGYRGIGQAVFADALYLRSPENLVQLASDGKVDAGKLKTYLAILLIYERFDLALKTLELLGASGQKLDAAYERTARAVFGRRKRDFDRRVRLLSRLGMLGLSTSPNGAIHYIY